MSVLSIDPTECWVRHIRRGVSSDASAKKIGLVYFVRDDAVTGTDGLNGRQGWQEAEATLVLSDDGSFRLTLPNAAGDDGVLHRRRFRALTDANYEPGEEWLEFWTDADKQRPLFVGTPTDYQTTKSSIVLRGMDAGVVLAGALSSDVDAWDGAAPADVLRHYSRLPVLCFGDDDMGITVSGASPYIVDLTAIGVRQDCFTIACRLRPTWVLGATAILNVGSVRLLVEPTTNPQIGGEVTLQDFYNSNQITSRRFGLSVADVGPLVELRIVTRYDRIFAFVNGDLVAEMRRNSIPPDGPYSLEVYVNNSTGILDSLHIETLAPFAARGASSVIERHLPGLPPATGLRGRYWNAAPLFARTTGAVAPERLRGALIWPLGEDPVVDRLDAQINFPAGTANYPPGIPGAYAARWTGAIYLDLAASDRQIRLSGLVGRARIYIARTLRGEEAASSWTQTGAPPATLTSGWLRSWIGEQIAGWYPILIEQQHDSAAAGIVLEDSTDGNNWTTVPTSRLSPIGCYEDLVRLTPHRTIIGDVAQAFGYQWRLEPRALESDEFPGQLVAKALVGRQTAVVIDDDAVGTDAQVTGSATDVIDGLLADAAGIAAPKGSGQLATQVVDYARASSHLALRQAYESLAEITEAPLLQARANSLLALRSSPNEQVGVRPRGQRDLVDTFPLTGALARMDWTPGDGVRLNLESLDVQDTSTRQMTQVAWPLRRDGLGAPTVGFRQRPRNVKATMKRLIAAIFGPRRTYQGSIAVVTGAPGGATSAGAPSNATDAYSRAPAPQSMDDVVRVITVVRSIAGSGWRLEVGGSDLGTPDGTVTDVGRYDVTRAAKQLAGQQQIYARLIGGTSGSYEITLEVWVRV